MYHVLELEEFPEVLIEDQYVVVYLFQLLTNTTSLW